MVSIIDRKTPFLFNCTSLLAYMDSLHLNSCNRYNVIHEAYVDYLWFIDNFIGGGDVFLVLDSDTFKYTMVSMSQFYQTVSSLDIKFKSKILSR